MNTIIPPPLSAKSLPVVNLPKDFRHRYQSLSQLWAALGVPAKRGEWRLSEYLLGHSCVAHHICGRMIATDGVHCILERSDRKWFEIHILNFVNDDAEEQVFFGRSKSNKRIGATKVDNRKVDIEAYL